MSYVLVHDGDDGAQVIGQEVVAERAFDVAQHLRFHGVERLGGRLTPNLQIVRSIPDDCGEISTYVLDLLEAV